SCPMETADIPCVECSRCDLLCGWGGAGAYSDGKLTLNPNVGGFLTDYLPEKEVAALVEYVDLIYRARGAGEEVYGTDEKAVAALQKKAAGHNLELVPSRIRHIGTDQCRKVLRNLRKELNGKVDCIFDIPVERIVAKNGKVSGIVLQGEEFIESRHLIVATGREGSSWMAAEAAQLGLSINHNPVDIGVRVELPAAVMEPITDITYEAKYLYTSKKFGDRVRTFCMNPHGEVVNEYAGGIFTVNGHSNRERKTGNTNFSLLVSTAFTKPFDDPISYGKYIASLANLLGDGVLVQRLGDLKKGRRSTIERINEGTVTPTLTDATPGDLSFVLPYRHLSNIMEMLEALDHVAPGVNSEDTLLYGVEVKFYSVQPRLTNGLETEVGNLFAVGDGAGVSRGLIQASISGMVAAREILKREEE
ncbi:MAG: FAD-dependent oxidoreductase, partial [Nitrospirota bacterium]|nr:FAD-dependent oxidoreductase [Nitrospirota bacterium]